MEFSPGFSTSQYRGLSTQPEDTSRGGEGEEDSSEFLGTSSPSGFSSLSRRLCTENHCLVGNTATSLYAMRSEQFASHNDKNQY